MTQSTLQHQAIKLLGLARRARKLALGGQAVEQALRRGKVALLVFANDVSPRSRSKLSRLAGNIPIRLWQGKGELGAIFQRRELGVLAVLDAHFAAGIVAALAQCDEQRA